MKYRKQWPCRCSKCRARKTLRKHPDDYQVRYHAFCPYCKTDTMRVDMYRKKKENKNTCYCIGVHYPHRPGSLVWCLEHPVGPTDDDFKERFKSFDGYSFIG